MESVNFAQLAERLGLDLDQVLEAVSLGPELRDLAGTSATARVIFDAVQLERSHTQRARPETDAEWMWAERYGEHWSD